jgi:hypothetical protein
VSTHTLETLDQLLDRGGEPDDLLRTVVSLLADEPAISWAGIAFLEDGKLALGPHAGSADEPRRVHQPITYQGAQVGELWIDGEAEQPFLERVALLISAHVLIGWDTRGERWEP